MFHKRMPSRLVVHSKDVQNITGYMPRTARQLLQTIRAVVGKPKSALVSVREFCKYTGLEEDLVKEFLKY